jgi:hypothetical protein
MQGFLFSRPVDSHGVLHLLARDSKRTAEPDINLAQHDNDVSLVYSM